MADGHVEPAWTRLRRSRRPPPRTAGGRAAGHGVVGNQVDQRGAAAQQADQSPRVFRPVVYAGQQDVLEGHAAARSLEVLVGGCQHGGDADVAIGRHQAAPQHVVGGVQRDGQVILAVHLGEPADARWQPDRGNGHPPGADSQGAGAVAEARAAMRASRFASGSPIPITTT